MPRLRRTLLRRVYAGAQVLDGRPVMTDDPSRLSAIRARLERQTAIAARWNPNGYVHIPIPHAHDLMEVIDTLSSRLQAREAEEQADAEAWQRAIDDLTAGMPATDIPTPAEEQEAERQLRERDTKETT